MRQHVRWRAVRRHVQHNRPGARTQAGWCRWQSPLGILPCVERFPVGYVKTGRNPTGRADPADSRPRSRVLRASRGQLPAQAPRDERPKRCACLRRTFLGLYQELVGDIHCRLHMGNHNTIFPYRSRIRPGLAVSPILLNQRDFSCAHPDFVVLCRCCRRDSALTTDGAPKGQARQPRKRRRGRISQVQGTAATTESWRAPGQRPGHRRGKIPPRGG